MKAKTQGMNACRVAAACEPAAAAAAACCVMPLQMHAGNGDSTFGSSSSNK
jgi:hypothetical protein